MSVKAPQKIKFLQDWRGYKKDHECVFKSQAEVDTALKLQSAGILELADAAPEPVAPSPAPEHAVVKAMPEASAEVKPKRRPKSKPANDAAE